MTKHLTSLTFYFLHDSPVSPDTMDWTTYYKKFYEKEENKSKVVEIADVGCGYGGLTGFVHNQSY